MDEEEDTDYLPPWNTNTLGVPNDPALIAVYELYKSPIHANRLLLTERKRVTFAEALNGPSSVPTLADLCVRQLAKRGTAHMTADVLENPLKMRIYYDSLDVDTPLRECYSVQDQSFWRRVVLAKSTDKCLAMKGLNGYDWRGKGLSLKYVELVEACPAAIWPEREMTRLALLIRDDVRYMDIRHLQSQSEFKFRKAGLDDDNTDPIISSEETQGMDISSDEPDTLDEAEGEEEEEDDNIEDVGITFTFDKPVTANKGDDPHIEQKRLRHERNAERQRLRDIKEAQREARKARQATSLVNQKPEEPRRKRRRKQRITGAFDIRVDPEPDDGDDKVMDKRNKQRYLDHLKKFEYPEEDCSHIDLSFVGHFDNLISLTLEFLGPAELGRDYHKRHLLFSVRDMVHLARGLVYLEQLQIFRLRNSHLDHLKLYSLCRVLRSLPALEVVDFGYDQMTDDCGPLLGLLLDRPRMLSSLELEFNRLDTRAMLAIGEALNRPSQVKLQYLGLGHNNLGPEALTVLLTHLKGTEHVQELDVSGIKVNGRYFTNEITELIRHHEPLRRLKMVAVPLSANLGRQLICSLNANTKITHIDCRGCDLDLELELEADIIVRRNIFLSENSFVLDTEKFPETHDLLEHAKTLHHPIMEKVVNASERREECFRHYPRWSQTPLRIETPLEVQEEESDYNIWEAMGVIQNRLTTQSTQQDTAVKHSLSSVSVPHIYDPNSFDLEEFRQHVYLPGPGNRYSYFQKHRNSIK
ncbi:uncharacterized protein [Drosophila kikkawai]|uniref:T-complex-associated testis-expressed protein 1 n=1 Tax=Drosophila kikkawai TaxID=30033 RepID=A0A6P4J330_DROKI|nr:uncharacterized protein LOC108079774 [Drosophila kikkawai]